MTIPKHLYKGRYLIALYDVKYDDEFEAVFTNAEELSIETYGQITSALSHFFRDKDRKGIIYHGRHVIPHLIDAFEDDIGTSVLDFGDTWFRVFPDDTRAIFHERGRKPVETTLDDERYQDRIIERISCERGALLIWLKKENG